MGRGIWIDDLREEPAPPDRWIKRWAERCGHVTNEREGRPPVLWEGAPAALRDGSAACCG